MHHIEITSQGTGAMMSVKQTPWHKLGTILPEAPTAQEAIKAAQLNWTVSKVPMYFKNANEELVATPDRFAVIRDTDSKYLGHAGSSWEPLQNTEAFSFFDPFIQTGEASFETAGSLDGGKRLWILARIKKDPIEVVKGDIVEKYVLLSNQHKAGVSVRGALTPIRVVCANTEAIAYKKATQIFRATHSAKMKDRLAQVQYEIAQAEAAFQETAEWYKQFAKTQADKKTLERFVNSVFNFADVVEDGRQKAFKDKQTETIVRLFETGRGSDIKGVRGTVWGLYNTVTEYIQHEMGKVEDKRLTAAWFGRGMDLNIKAFNVAKDLVVA